MIRYIFIPALMISIASTASANNINARISYQTQTCHHSTAPIVKMALKKASKSEERFCECVANQAVSQNLQIDDHAYALAYHEINIVLERSKRYKQSQTEIIQEMSKRTEGYNYNHGISSKKLEKLSTPALETMLNCKDLTVPQIRNRFKGS